MSARDELATIIHDAAFPGANREDPMVWPAWIFLASDRAIAAGYTKPRTITTAEELESLPFGSAVQTSDDSDTVVLKAEGILFRNQSGACLSSTDLWRFGTHPFTAIYEPEPTK